jgi:hypothetical protein
MYGSWFGAVMGVAGVLLLVVAAMLTAWTPIFAFAAFAVIGAALLVLAAMRRTAEDVPGREVHRGDPERHAAPVGGEGSNGSAADTPEATEPEGGPEPESAGIWGERG